MTALDRQQGVASAIAAALAGDAQLAALIGKRIYEAPPPRAVMPSITLRVVSCLDRCSADTDAQLIAVDLDVWDRYEPGTSLAAPRLVMAHIRRILHMRSLPPPASAVLSVRCTASFGPVRDPEDIALHGTVSVAVLCGHDASLA